jgi:hypothetical protein
MRSLRFVIFCISLCGSFWGCSNFVSPNASSYVFVYDANGADSGSVPTDNDRYKAGEEVIVKDNDGNLLKAGLVFSGWNTKPNGTGVTYKAGSAFNVGMGDTRLYALWTQDSAQNGTVEAPAFSLAAGTYTGTQSLILSSTTGASIRYTTDGTDPTSATGIIYSGTIFVSRSQAIRAIAYRSGWEDSVVSSANYVITGTIEAPAFSLAAGTYTVAQSLILSSTAGASIRYTTDGTDPTSATGIIYSGTISVSTSQTIRAIAYMDGWEDSAISSARYLIAGTMSITLVGVLLGDYAVTFTLASDPGIAAPDMSGTYPVYIVPRSSLPLIVDAVVDPAVSGYIWLLDGVAQASGDPSIQLTAASLSARKHNLTLQITNGNDPNRSAAIILDASN